MMDISRGGMMGPWVLSEGLMELQKNELKTRMERQKIEMKKEIVSLI